MIHVDRPALTDPEGIKLLTRAGIAKQVLITAFGKHEKLTIDKSIYDAYKDYLLKLFNGKCAYCEEKIAANQPGDVEHYRPKNRVTDEQSKPVRVTYPDIGECDHMGYFWLAYDWDNLLPSCAECNRYRNPKNQSPYGKLDRFPIEGTRIYLPDQNPDDERPLLLDPTRTEPNDHFIFQPDGLISAKTKAGEVTLELLGLNIRETLVRERKREYANAERALADFMAVARGNDLVRIDELRTEVNEAFLGKARHTAFARLAFSDFQAKLARFGTSIQLPIREMTQ
jgi:hypothetical protein